MSAEVDADLAALPPVQAETLQSLPDPGGRMVAGQSALRLIGFIRSNATRSIHRWFLSWISFNLNQIEGKPLDAAFARNCGCYPHSGNIIARFTADRAASKTTPGAIQFTATQPNPPALVLRLIDARLAEIAATGG